MEPLGYGAAILMGLSLGLIGGGGSILTVPILVYLFGVGAVLASGYSLFIVGATALVGGLTYLRRGEVELRTGLLFATPSFVGVYLTRAFIMPALPEVIFNFQGLALTKADLVMVVFAILMLGASLSMIRGPAVAAAEPRRKAPAHVLIAIEGLVVGAITGFVGAGGGFLIIPALVLLVGMPMRKAVGTSLVIIAAKSLIGFLGDLPQQAHTDWKLLLSITGIALVGLFGGVALSNKVPERRLKKGFGFFVLVMGVAILLDQLLR